MVYFISSVNFVPHFDTQKSMKPSFGHPVSKYWLKPCLVYILCNRKKSPEAPKKKGKEPTRWNQGGTNKEAKELDFSNGKEEVNIADIQLDEQSVCTNW